MSVVNCETVILYHVTLFQLMAGTLLGVNGQNAQQLVVEEHACAIDPALTLLLRTEERPVWIRDWVLN